ncbi:hypothetical protein [Chryseobacterium hispalense]|uniref:hypothetical protein n=1 Tax=Chryseobacterium hispalense TaxID=1453492 RepID=UPI0006918D05|nr:hypothetical protein [Chryseobacterium hispalense]
MKVYKFFILFFSIFILSCTSKNIKKANLIINKIENYRKVKHTIPDNLGIIGVQETEEGPVYYKKIDSSNYIVWVQAESSLGESKIYYSDTQKWEDGFRKELEKKRLK